MLLCPRCRRPFPSVEGARSQVCPRCGQEQAAAVPDAPAFRAADPVGAAAHAVGFVRRRYGFLLLAWLPALVADLVVKGVVSWHPDVVLATGGGPVESQQYLRALAVMVPLLVPVVTLKLGLFSVVAAGVLDEAAPLGGSSRVRRLARRPLVWLALGLVLTLAYVAGLVLFLVAFLVFFHWFQFAPAALADRGRGVADALEASRRFARERRTAGFAALVLFVALGAGLAWFVGSGLAVRALAGAGLPREAMEIVVGSLLSWLLTPVVAVFPASFWALAATAREASGVEGPAPVRAPLRTTKCPECDTPIPFAPTGGPVDVTCPVCGRTGRVV